MGRKNAGIFEIGNSLSLSVHFSIVDSKILIHQNSLSKNLTLSLNRISYDIRVSLYVRMWNFIIDEKVSYQLILYRKSFDLFFLTELFESVFLSKIQPTGDPKEDSLRNERERERERQAIIRSDNTKFKHARRRACIHRGRGVEEQNPCRGPFNRE